MPPPVRSKREGHVSERVLCDGRDECGQGEEEGATNGGVGLVHLRGCCDLFAECGSLESVCNLDLRPDRRAAKQSKVSETAFARRRPSRG